MYDFAQLYEVNRAYLGNSRFFMYAIFLDLNFHGKILILFNSCVKKSAKMILYICFNVYVFIFDIANLVLQSLKSYLNLIVRYFWHELWDISQFNIHTTQLIWSLIIDFMASNELFANPLLTSQICYICRDFNLGLHE